jgi:beta-lactamase regulating signal transducer with metallopeptidase domain
MNTLTTFFDWLLTASLRASALTLGVWLVQSMLQKHLSPRWRYALWLPVLVVLLMPVLPESRWSAASVFTMEAPAAAVPPVSVIAEGMPVVMPVSAVLPSEQARPIHWSRVRVVAWAAGASLVLLTGMISFTHTLTRARRTRETISEDLANRIDEVTQEVGLRQKPRLLMSARIQSPAVTGLLRPLLLLPPGFDRDFTAEEKSLILHHELMHLKRGDLPLNTLLCVLMALHWFNPLLWFAFFKVRADREAACDAQVLENATPQRRGAYGHALLKIESAFAPLRLSLGFIGILQRHASLRARIRSIAAPARTRPFTGMLAMVCMLGMTFLGVTRAATELEKTTQIEITARFIEVNGPRNVQDGADKMILEALSEIAPTNATSVPSTLMFDDAQHQKLMRKLSQKKGVDLMAAPRVVTLSGKKATIEVAREFKWPEGMRDQEMKVGVKLDVLPTLQKADGIDLELDSRIVEFDGFVEREKGEKKPKFSERKAEAQVTVKVGQTVLLNIGSRTDKQEVEDIHDGKTERHTDHFTRRAIVLVTAQIVGKQKAEKASAEDKKAAPAKITADQTSFDEKTGIGSATGHAKLEVTFEDGPHITADAEEIEMHQHEDLVIVKAPLEVTLLGMRIRCEDKKGEAVIHLKTGKFQTRGATFRTELLEKPAVKNAASEAEAQAAKLRAARPQQYDFSKANLGDVLRYLATDAKIQFFALPEDHPASQKLVTFSLKDSPFAVLETIAKANGLMLVLDKGVWYIRPSDDADLISRTYPLLNSTVKPAEILDAVLKLAKAPASVKFDEKSGTFLVNATRLQQSWVAGYFKGLHGKR